ISLRIGEKPDTTAPGATATGNGRAAIAAAAAARASAGTESRRASAAPRRLAFSTRVGSEESIGGSFYRMFRGGGNRSPTTPCADQAIRPGAARFRTEPDARSILAPMKSQDEVRSRDGRRSGDPGNLQR